MKTAVGIVKILGAAPFVDDMLLLGDIALELLQKGLVMALGYLAQDLLFHTCARIDHIRDVLKIHQ